MKRGIKFKGYINELLKTCIRDKGFVNHESVGLLLQVLL